MANPIGWCDETWNPIVGCSKCSLGCKNCYTETMAIRLAGMGQEKYKKVTGMLYGGRKGWNGEVEFDESVLKKPFHWKKPRTIFINSMGDTFHESVPYEWIDRVMDVIHDCHWHKFIILTKRAEEMAEYMKKAEARLVGKWTARAFVDGAVNEPVWPLPNLALGVTAETQEIADHRIPILLQIPAAVRFVSVEPMLENVNVKKYLPGCSDEFWENGRALEWVICGGETGHGARPMEPKWVRNVRDDCQDTGVPFFFKGWGEWLPDDQIDCNTFVYKKGHPGAPSWAIDKPCTHLDIGLHAFKVGSKKSGCMIDGIEYRQRPAGW